MILLYIIAALALTAGFMLYLKAHRDAPKPPTPKKRKVKITRKKK
jgi:hypothetical protein